MNRYFLVVALLAISFFVGHTQAAELINIPPYSYPHLDAKDLYVRYEGAYTSNEVSNAEGPAYFGSTIYDNDWDIAGKFFLIGTTNKEKGQYRAREGDGRHSIHLLRINGEKRNIVNYDNCWRSSILSKSQIVLECEKDYRYVDLIKGVEKSIPLTDLCPYASFVPYPKGDLIGAIVTQCASAAPPDWWTLLKLPDFAPIEKKEERFWGSLPDFKGEIPRYFLVEPRPDHALDGHLVPAIPDYLKLAKNETETSNDEASHGKQYPTFLANKDFDRLCTLSGSTAPEYGWMSWSPDKTHFICVSDSFKELGIFSVVAPKEVIDNYTDEFKLTAEKLRSLAQSKYKKKDYTGAVSTWTDVLRKDPYDPDALNDIGFTLDSKLNRSEEGISYIIAALEISPERSVAWLNLGDAYSHLGTRASLRSALVAYREFLKRDPEHPRALKIKEWVTSYRDPPLITEYANCQFKLDEAKGEAPLEFRSDGFMMPPDNGMGQNRYGAMLVAEHAILTSRELEAINPRIFIFDSKTCAALKVIQLYPKDLSFHPGLRSYMVSFNQPQGLIYVTSYAAGFYPDETRYYYYTEIYSFDDLSLISRIEGETPLIRAQFVDSGKKIVHVEGSREQEGYLRVKIFAANLTAINQSELIGKERFSELAIQPKGAEVDIGLMEEKWFKDNGYNVELDDQYAIKLRGKDAEGNYRSVDFSLEGKPLLAVWREAGKAVVGYPSDYEKKFDLEIEPIKFSETQSGTPEKRSVSPEPVPRVVPRKRPLSIEEQIRINQVIAAERVAEDKKAGEMARQMTVEAAQEHKWMYCISITLLVALGFGFLFYRSRRSH